MGSGIGLMYLEGEMKGGRLTGRTVLVVETDLKIDIAPSRRCSADLQRLIRTACFEWEKHCQAADLVRVEHHPRDEDETTSHSSTAPRAGSMGLPGSRR